MPTFANDDNGNTPLYYIPITLSGNDGSGFQQMVAFNASNYSSYLANNLSNVNFQDGNGNLLYSWQETHGATNSSTSVIYWVKLPNSTITTIYMVLVATTSSSLSTNHTGAEPTNTSTYGQYDNGANVFSIYFNGAAPSSKFSIGASVTFSNLTNQTWRGISTTSLVQAALSGSPNDIMSLIYTTGFAIPSNGIVAESDAANTTTSSGLAAGTLGVCDSTTISTSSPTNAINVGAGWGANKFFVSYANSSGRVGGQKTATGASNSPWYWYLTYANGATSFNGYANTSLYVFSSSATYAPASETASIASGATVYLGITMYNTTSTSNVQINWMRMRVMPTSNTMPTQSFGSITPAAIYYLQPRVLQRYEPQSVQTTKYQLILPPAALSASGSSNIQAAASTVASSIYGAEVGIQAAASTVASSVYGAEVGIQASASAVVSLAYNAEVGIQTASSLTFAPPFFANDDNGNSPFYYIPITLSGNDGNGFQQMVTFNASNYSSYLANNLSNVNFQDGNGNLLYSWQETHGATNSSTSVIYWVKLPNPPITTIYMVLVNPNASSLSGNHTGAEPTNTSTYGQYDNGANVFTEYWNFAGTSLPTGFTSITSSDGILQVNNGVTFGSGTSNAPSYSYIAYTTTQYSGISEANFIAGTNPGGYGGVSLGPGFSNTTSLTPPSVSAPPSWYIGLLLNSGGGSFGWSLYNAGTQLSSASGASWANQVLSSSNNPINGYSNYGSVLTSSASNNPSYVASGIESPGLSAGTPESASFSINWLRVRNYPASGTMPTQSFGNATLLIHYLQPKVLQRYEPQLIQITAYQPFQPPVISASGESNIQAAASIVASSVYGAEVGIQAAASVIASSAYGAEASIQAAASAIASSAYNAEVGIQASASTVASSIYGAEVGIQAAASLIASSIYNAEANLQAIASVIASSLALGEANIEVESIKPELTINVSAAETSSNIYSAEAGISSTASSISSESYGASAGIQTAASVLSASPASGEAGIAVSAIAAYPTNPSESEAGILIRAVIATPNQAL